METDGGLPAGLAASVESCPLAGLVWRRDGDVWSLALANEAARRLVTLYGATDGTDAWRRLMGTHEPNLQRLIEDAHEEGRARVQGVELESEAVSLPPLDVDGTRLAPDLVVTWMRSRVAGGADTGARGEAAWFLFDRGEQAASVWRVEGEQFVLEDYNLAAVRASAGRISAFVGRRAREMYEGQEGVVEFLRATAERGRIVDPEFRYRSASTGELGIHHVMGLRSGQRVFIFTRDRTSDHARDESLRVSRAMLEAILSASPIGLVRLDGQGRIEETNRHWQRLHAASRPAVRTPWESFVDEEMREQTRDDVQQAMQAVRPARFEYRVVGTEDRWVLAELVPVVPESNAQWLMVSLDITELRRARNAAAEREHRLQRAEKMESIGRLAGGVAHDFNNVLAAITGLIELAIPETPEDSQLHADLKEVLQTARRAAELVRQLLAFGRQQPMEPRPLDLGEAVRAVVPLLQRYLGGTTRIEVEVAPDVPVILADPSQVDRVMVNLAVNARDAMPGGGTLTLAVAPCGAALCRKVAPELLDGEGDATQDCGFVALRITDTGEGIAAEHLPRLFEPFFTTRPEGKGAGLGLASVHGIVEQLRGRIHVESTLGQGSTFTVLWPTVTRARETSERERAERTLPTPEPGRRVLLVDDDPVVRMALGRLLLRHGFDVREAADGMEARALLEADGPPDVLVTDVVMPRLSGPELALEARERWPDLPVLFVTGYQDDATVRAESLAPPRRLLVKPVPASDLLAAVDELADTGHPRRPD